MKNLLTILFFCISCHLHAQQGSIFEKITTENGLPTNYIFCITEDENGFIWAGSDKGLLKFDGAKWQVFDTDNGLPGNYVNTVFSDKRGGLWLGISEKQCIWFNIKNSKVVPIKYPNNIDIKKYSFGLNENNDLSLTSSNTNIGYKYLSTNPIIPIQFFVNNPIRNYNEHYISYPKEKKKIVIVSINAKQGNLPTEDNDSTHYIFQKLHNDMMYKFLNHPEPNDFLTGDANYLAGYNFVLKITPNSSSILTEEKLFERNKKQCSFLQDGKTIYFSKLGEGVCAIDTLTGKVTRYNTKNGLSSNDVNTIFKASDGAIYFSTLGGGINIIKYPNRTKFDLPKLPINSIQFYDGKYYVQAKNSICVISNNTIERTISISKEILSFFIQKNKLYIGSFDGLEQYNVNDNNPAQEKIVRNTAGISCIIVSNNNFIATTYGGGFLTTNNFTTQKRVGNLPFANIEKLFSLQNGYASISYENGFFVSDKNLRTIKYFTQKEGLLSNAVYCVHEYKDSLLVGSKNGITVITKNNIVKIYSFKEGFIGKKAMYIFTDNAGVHWVLSDLLQKVENGKLKNEGTINSLINSNDNITGAYYNSINNELAIGTKKGFFLINLKKTENKFELNEPIIINVKINDSTIGYNETYTLPYNYKNIRFYFSNSNNGLFKNYTTLIKIDGQGNNWISLSDSLTLNLDQLRPGTYKIFAKSISLDGRETAEKRLTTIKIKQPLLLQPWMLFLYTIFSICFIYFVVQYFNRKKYKAKLETLRIQEELENERQRISRDLHDNMGAYTNALLTNVQQLKNKTAQEEDLQKMQNNAEQILSSLRETIWVLSVKEVTVQEFSDGFKDYCFKLLRNFEHINFNGEENIVSKEILPAKIAIHLNKILQEAVQNIIKHSGGDVINYSINNSAGLKITIADNGKGFIQDTNNAGNGLKNIQWRANEIGMNFLMTSSGAGTIISIQNKET